jgi:hypothetical protein
MINQHPITPPPKLVQQWASMFEYHPDEKVFSEVARWGADQELEACCMWITREKSVLIAEELGIARRPKLPTLKEQALAALREVGNCEEIDNTTYGTIRRALEALPND